MEIITNEILEKGTCEICKSKATHQIKFKDRNLIIVVNVCENHVDDIKMFYDVFKKHITLIKSTIGLRKDIRIFQTVEQNKNNNLTGG